MTTVDSSGVPDKSPDPDCPQCDGEGVDLDPFGLFDFEVRGTCPICWMFPQEEEQK